MDIIQNKIRLTTGQILDDSTEVKWSEWSDLQGESRMVITSNWERRKGELLLNVYRVSVLPEEKNPGVWLHKM